MANAQEHRGSSPAERWFDHVVRALTVAAIIGGAVWLTDMRSQIVGIQKDLGYLTQQIGELKGLTEITPSTMRPEPSLMKRSISSGFRARHDMIMPAHSKEPVPDWKATACATSRTF